MANDRMWLVHRSSGKRVLIAKHFGGNWQFYTGKRHKPYYDYQELFDEESGPSQNYTIEYEDV